jgi:hypothetical protein
MTTKEKIQRLAALFRAADRAAKDADPGPDADGGTCNLDSPAFRVQGMQRRSIEAAAEEAGVTVARFTWLGGRKWYWLNCALFGQANRRSAMMKAALDALRTGEGTIPGLSVCGYYQMD